MNPKIWPSILGNGGVNVLHSKEKSNKKCNAPYFLSSMKMANILEMFFFLNP